MSWVTNPNMTFDGSSSFDGDLSKWDPSAATGMYKTFQDAPSFRGSSLVGWDVSSVKDTEGVFNGATAFDCDLSKWDVSKWDVSKWDVSKWDFSQWDVS